MKRVAVVEDEVYMREELCNMLQKDGYLVEAITEFEDAARLLAALRPDLVNKQIDEAYNSAYSGYQYKNDTFTHGYRFNGLVGPHHTYNRNSKAGIKNH